MFDLRAETRGGGGHKSQSQNEKEMTSPPEIKVQQPVMEYMSMYETMVHSSAATNPWFLFTPTK